MELVEAEAKKWGNSLGVILPRDVVEKEHIKENQKIGILIIKDSSKTLKSSFGILKGKMKKSSQQIKDELRAELYD